MKKYVLSANYFAIAVYIQLIFWKYNVYQTIGQGIFLFFYIVVCEMLLVHFLRMYSMVTMPEKKAATVMLATLSLAVCMLCRESVVLDIPQENLVQITALGEKNSDAKGAEVWITGISTGSREISLADIPLENGWIYRAQENAIVAYPDGMPAVLSIDTGRSEEIKLVFVKHEWSGKVQIKANQNDPFSVDLYSNQTGDTYLCTLKGEAYSHILLDVFSFSMALELCFLFFCFLYILYQKKKELLALYGMAYSFLILEKVRLYEINRWLALAFSAVFAVIVYFVCLESRTYLQNKQKKLLFVFLCITIAFMLFGARLFLIPRNYEAKTWFVFLALVIWCAPWISGAIKMLDSIRELLLKNRKEEASKQPWMECTRKITGIAVGILFGFLIGSSFFQMFAYTEQKCTVTITPSGEKNEDALGYEVLLNGIYIDGASYDPGRLPDGWENLNGTLKGTGTQGLTLYLPKAKDIKLVFLKHEWSGIVKIEDGGKENYIDLFSGKNNVSYLETYQVRGNRKYQTSAYFIILMLLMGTAAALVFIYIWQCLTDTWKNEVKPGRFFWTIWLTGGLIYAVYMVASYPASICIDGRTQLLQVFGYEPLTDAHPAVHTLLMKLLTVNGRCIVLFPIFQMLCLSFLSACILCFLYRKKRNRKCLIILGIVFPFMINHGIYTTILWKDELFSIHLLLLSYFLYRIETDKNYLQQKRNICYVGIALAGVRLLRHNGIIVYLVVILLFFILAFLRKNWRYLVCSMSAILLVMVIRGPVYDLAGVENKSDGTTLSSMMHGIVYAGITDDVPQETEAFLTEFMPMDKWVECFHPYSANELVRSDTAIQYGVSEKLNSMGTGTVFKEYLRVLLSKPLRLIEDRLFGIDLMWNVVRDNGYDWRVANDTYEVGVAENTMGLYRHDNIFTRVVCTVSNRSMENKLSDSFFWRAGIWTCMLFILIYYGYIRRIKLWMLYIPVLGNMFSLCLAMAWQDFRYVYFMNLCLPFLIFMCLSEKTKEDAFENSNHHSRL